MRQMLLDESRDNPRQAGYMVVDDEVTFLRLALTETPLHVQGTRLCAWAAALCEARGWDCHHLSSPVSELADACPGLDRKAANAIVALLGSNLAGQARPLQPLQVAAALWPTAGVWVHEPTVAHAARWLVWLAEGRPAAETQPLLRAIAEAWRLEARNTSPDIADVYSVSTHDESWTRLQEWLGILDSTMAWPPFPLVPLPAWLVARLRQEWTPRIISTAGAFFEQLAGRHAHREAVAVAAAIAADYFERHPAELIGSRWDQLAPYLSSETRRKIEPFVSPEDPGVAPTELDAAIAWFQGPYLRFRVWEAAYGGEAHRERRRELARNFGAWFVGAYARARSGGPGSVRLSWSKTARLSEVGDRVTLLVILDGLGYRDATHLLAQISERSGRLTLAAQEVALAPLPTVTEFAKPALRTGVTPVRAVDEENLGSLQRTDTEVVNALSAASPGQIVIWSLLEPDKTYHSHTTRDAAEYAVAGCLLGLAQRIVAIAHAVREECPLRVVIATDHGRLLSSTERRVPAPPGMTSHGRAAWGATDRPVGVEGYVIDGDLAYLHHDRFAIAETCAVLLSDDAFFTADGRGGSEPYPHGGVYPEEVFIPWIELLRDVQLQPPTAELTGSGVAGAEGEMSLQVMNLGQVSLVLEALEVSVLGWRFALGRHRLDPMAPHTFPLPLRSWPTPQALVGAQAFLTYSLPNGDQRVVPCSLRLTSEELYTRPNILDDLGGLE